MTEEDMKFTLPPMEGFHLRHEASQRQYTGQMRWLVGSRDDAHKVLQQQVLVWGMNNGIIVSQYTEWETVPEVVADATFEEED